MQIRKIISNGVTYYKQDEISKAISNFYRDLYKKQTDLKPIHKDDEMLKNLPKLNDQEKNDISKPLTITELNSTLFSCQESAPGPDGISYNVYKKTWDCSGRIILDAWNHSINIGQTSQSQREAVITLLEKKGKDKSILANLRPVSLSNCDIKICTKTIALRTNKLLEKLLSDTQTGYVPGRQVTNNNRMIEEIIELVNKSDDEAYLITLDAQKAFDSVDHTYLLEVLKAYNFPETYINWVRVIYRNLEASVLVNGYTTQKFKIEQSVKQGDALSCALFVLAIEPLLRNIERNEKINPISLPGLGSNTIKIKKAGYADDITGLTSNVASLQVIIEEYEKFSSVSGIRLNVAKTEIMVLGKNGGQNRSFVLKHRNENFNVTEQKSVTICGITFSNDKEESYSRNVLQKIAKLERQLNIWRQRNLTLEGKILITKTFGLSQIIYSMQSTYFRKEDLKKIDNTILKFIWNLKPDTGFAIGKIKRQVLISSVEKGGLNAPDIFAIDKAIKYKTLILNLHQKHPVKFIYDTKCSDLNFDFVSFYCGVKEESFIGKACQVHVESLTQIKDDIKILANEVDGVHKNYYSVIQNSDLVKNDFVNIRQQNLLNRLKVYNIDNFQKLCEEKRLRRFPMLFLDVHQVYSVYPNEWKLLLNNTRRTHNPITEQVRIGLNKWSDRNNVNLKMLITSLINSNNINVDELITKRNSDINIASIRNNPFVVLRRNIKDVKIRNLQFKMLHNIYPTLMHLKRWKIKDSENCTRCNVKETLKHVTWDCHVAREAFLTLESEFNERYYGGTPRVILSYDDVALGLSTTKSLSNTPSIQLVAMDTVIIELKQKLILQRENKIFLEREEIINLFEQRKNIELYNKIKYSKKTNIFKKWGRPTY